MTTTTYTAEAKELLGEFVQRAGKTFLVVKASDVFGEPTTIRITPANLAEFYATRGQQPVVGDSDACRAVRRLEADQRVGEPRPRLVQERERRGDAPGSEACRTDPEVLEDCTLPGVKQRGS